MYQGHKLLIANRGEIAVRILRTAKELGLPTVTIYTPSDSLSPHVTLADEAVPLPAGQDFPLDSGKGEAHWYLSSAMILHVCQMKGVTLLHPGYGFLSENAEFAAQVVEAGIIWLGPRPETIKAMGLKHTARSIARQAGLELVPGSEGLVHDVEQASLLSQAVGFPIMLKATAGGGGMGMVVCHSESELRREFGSIRQRAKTLFNDDGVFLERFFPSARHIEVQIFGNGLGDVVHMGERECSIQRRHQKIIEETPSPFLISRPELRNSMCLSAVKLCRSINYASAGTVEFLVDDETGSFYFLEMNTRIQVEHPITEQTYPGLDIVKLMIQQGIAERQAAGGLESDSLAMQQKTYDLLRQHGAEMGHVHSIEGRIYAENPIEDFLPSPGILTYVNLHSGDYDWLRIETWISTGLNITPFFDPLLAKLIVSGTTREEAIGRFLVALDECQILGPPNNVEYLKSITADSTFRSGRATTSFLSQFPFVPNAITVLSAGIDATVQDLPGRTVGLGVPRSGPMDSLAFRVCNKLVGNQEAVEALEIIVVHGVYFAVKFWVSAVVAITGMDVLVTVDGRLVDAWARIVIPSGAILRLEAKSDSSGCRSYLAVQGGFPGIPTYLGSKSTSMGFGGYQGRSLRAQDQLSLAKCGPAELEEIQALSVPPRVVPRYPSHWEIHVLPGPQDDDEFVTAKGVAKFYSSAWRISSSSNRMGIRLESLDDQPIQWARKSGGQGGSHPSNILDNGYSPGSININGDTPVILTCEGPDMGGYLCFCTVASADMWKLGQLSPGSTVSFRRINWNTALHLHRQLEEWLSTVVGLPSNGPNVSPLELPIDTSVDKTTPKPTVLHRITQSGGSARPTVLLRRALQRMIPNSSLLHRIVQSGDNARPAVVFRQAGDSAILVEFGPMYLDFAIRVRLHVFEKEIRRMEIRGSKNISACVRSLLYQYDPLVISQAEALVALQRAERSIPTSVTDLKLPGRRFTFPIVLDDSWSRNALDRYMQTTRKTAVYLPSNIEYLAKNNGLRGGSKEALDKLIGTDWLIFGVGFYLACPFLVPIDPRARLVGQKMNPSRTYTPRGAIGIAGPVAAIYPVESPGGYQLYGRTLPAWQTWGRGPNFHPDRPWLLESFDQVHFELINESDYLNLEKSFDSGRYLFKVEPTTFSMKDYAKLVSSTADEVAIFRRKQAKGTKREEGREKIFLKEWYKAKENTKNEATKQRDSAGAGTAIRNGSATITAPMFASVWKINCAVGGVIQSAGEVLIILEAMKTEVPVKAGPSNVGKMIRSLGDGIKLEAAVRPGDVLLVLE